jgi:hypothetical protein
MLETGDMYEAAVIQVNPHGKFRIFKMSRAVWIWLWW